jgi:uncharacterized spore protein YtfJ
VVTGIPAGRADWEIHLIVSAGWAGVGDGAGAGEGEGAGDGAGAGSGAAQPAAIALPIKTTAIKIAIILPFFIYSSSSNS